MKKNIIFIISILTLRRTIIYLYYDESMRTDISNFFIIPRYNITEYYHNNTNKIDYLHSKPKFIDIETITTGLQLDLSNGQSYIVSGKNKKKFINNAIKITLSTGASIDRESTTVQLISCKDTFLSNDVCQFVGFSVLKNGYKVHLSQNEIDSLVISCVIIDPYNLIQPKDNKCSLIKNSEISQESNIGSVPTVWSKEDNRRHVLINRMNSQISAPVIIEKKTN